MKVIAMVEIIWAIHILNVKEVRISIGKTENSLTISGYGAVFIGLLTLLLGVFLLIRYPNLNGPY